MKTETKTMGNLKLAISMMELPRSASRSGREVASKLTGSRSWMIMRSRFNSFRQSKQTISRSSVAFIVVELNRVELETVSLAGQSYCVSWASLAWWWWQNAWACSWQWLIIDNAFICEFVHLVMPKCEGHSGNTEVDWECKKLPGNTKVVVIVKGTMEKRMM